MLTIERLCCFRLHTAGVLIGWVGAAFSLINIIVNAVVLSRLDEIIKYIIDKQDPDSTLSAETLKTIAIVAIAIYLTLSVVNLISSSLLIAGTIKERHLMLVPWLINSGIVLLFSALNFVYVICYAISNGDSFESVIGILFTTGVILGIQYIIWTAIYSLFRHIRSSREQEQLIPNKSGSAYPSYTRI